MNPNQIIIGITGTLGAGKGTIVEYLRQKGFKHYSSRALLIKEIEKRGLSVNRDSMVKVGNDLRAKYGSSYIAEQGYQQAQADGANAVIESLRTPGEINSLRKKNNFYLFAIDADSKKRYKRITNRGSETDQVTFEQFIANENREMASNDPSQQNINQCIKMADYKFDNSGTFEDLYRQVDKVLAKII